MLAKCGVQVSLTDLFGVAGLELLDRFQEGQRLPTPYLARVRSLRRVIDDLDFEIDLFAGIVRGRLARDPGYLAVQQIPGIGPVLGAVFVAEVGDVTRFNTAAQLACWAGLTPKHRESDTHVHRGRITKQGSRLVRWAAVESVQLLPAHTKVGAVRERVAARQRPQHRGRGRRPRPGRAGLLRTARPPRPSTPPAPGRGLNPDEIPDRSVGRGSCRS